MIPVRPCDSPGARSPQSQGNAQSLCPYFETTLGYLDPQSSLSKCPSPPSGDFLDIGPEFILPVVDMLGWWTELGCKLGCPEIELGEEDKGMEWRWEVPSGFQEGQRV